MGNQPALDGLRALAVVAVLCYHGGFSWMDGGFFGVEVFFVISGFLITTLLLEEQLRTRGIRFGAFWLRRARRLLPALATLLVVVGLYVWWFGSPTQAAQMRTDYPWSIFYAANWGQIFAGVPYFGTVTPAPLRNLWSLGVEEQWYLIWPLAFVGLMRLRTTRVRRGVLLLGISGFVMLVSAVVAHGTLGPSAINFLYLSTFTRSSGLLLGAALAFLWRPWTRTANPAVTRRARRRRDRVMPRLNLRNKLILFAVVIAIIPLLIAGQSLIRIARDEMKSSANDQLVATTRQVADEIDTYFEQTLMAPLLLIRSALDDEKLGIEEKIALLTHGIADLSDVVALQALGTTFLLLVWLYVMANVIVFGAALNYVLAYGVTGREVRPRRVVEGAPGPSPT